MVEAVNERDIKLNGGWLNVSKYHAVALPMRGAEVALEVEGGRWIRRCDVLDGDIAGVPQNTAGTRDRTITRLALLKAAAAFAASRPEARSEHVTKIADAWLAWVGAE